jgi:predicted Zn-dependent peptidase
LIHTISKTHSRLSTIVISFNAGARVEQLGSYNSGIAHMLEHSIFKGTSDRTATQLQKEIAFLGGESNAYTSHDMVCYYITVPFENLEPCIEILKDMVFNSTFPEEEFLKEKEVVKEEEISRSDAVQSYIWKNFSQNFFDNYLSRPVIGTQDSISLFSREEVVSFHTQFCQKSDAVISLCSNLKSGAAKELLRKHFGVPNGKIKKSLPLRESGYLPSRRIDITKEGIEHTYVWMGMPGFTTSNRVDAAAQVLTTILGSGMDSRLFTEVRENRGLVYGIGSSHSSWDKGGVTLIDFSTRDKNVEEAISLVKDEVSKITSLPSTSEEIQRAKNKIKSGFYHAMEDSYSLAQWSLKEKLLDWPTIEQHMTYIEEVDQEQIFEAAKIILNQDKMLTVVCKKPE